MLSRFSNIISPNAPGNPTRQAQLPPHPPDTETEPASPPAPWESEDPEAGPLTAEPSSALMGKRRAIEGENENLKSESHLFLFVCLSLSTLASPTHPPDILRCLFPLLYRALTHIKQAKAIPHGHSIRQVYYFHPYSTDEETEGQRG